MTAVMPKKGDHVILVSSFLPLRSALGRRAEAGEVIDKDVMAKASIRVTSMVYGNEADALVVKSISKVITVASRMEREARVICDGLSSKYTVKPEQWGVPHLVNWSPLRGPLTQDVAVMMFFVPVEGVQLDDQVKHAVSHVIAFIKDHINKMAQRAAIESKLLNQFADISNNNQYNLSTVDLTEITSVLSEDDLGDLLF